jgi:hypothetical protein
MDGPHGADREALAKVDVIEGADLGKVALEFEGEFDGGDFFGIAMGEIGDVAFTDLIALAVGFAEIDGLIGLAIGGGPDRASHIHVHIIQQII